MKVAFMRKGQKEKERDHIRFFIYANDISIQFKLQMKIYMRFQNSNVQNSHAVSVLYYTLFSIESTCITCQCIAAYKNYTFLFYDKNDPTSILVYQYILAAPMPNLEKKILNRINNHSSLYSKMCYIKPKIQSMPALSTSSLF